MADDGGISRLRKRMAAIPQAMRIAIRPALEKSADDVVALAKSLCPYDALRDTIGWTWGNAPAGSRVLSQSGAGEMTITVHAGNDEVFYARWVEYGTQAGVAGQRVSNPGKGSKQHKSKGRIGRRTHPGTAARPFFFPAYRLSKKRVQSRIRSAIRKAVKENWGGS